MFFAIIVIVIAVDQFTKFLISGNLTVGQSIDLYGDILSFTSVRNTGAAYSILQDHTQILIYAVAVILAALLLYVLISWKGLSRLSRTAFALIIGGGAANLLDRYFLGYVVDFIDIKIIPVFNFADIAICTGCGLLILDVLIIEPIQRASKKHREKKAARAAENEAKAREEAMMKAEEEAKARAEADAKAEEEANAMAEAEARSKEKAKARAEARAEEDDTAGTEPGAAAGDASDPEPGSAAEEGIKTEGEAGSEAEELKSGGGEGEASV